MLSCKFVKDDADLLHEARLEAGSITRQARRVLAECPLEPEMPLALPLRTGWRVYVIRDLLDRVLYVGMTKNLWQRIGQHANKAPWWDEAMSMVSFPCSGRDRAISMEHQLIAMLGPIHNKYA